MTNRKTGNGRACYIVYRVLPFLLFTFLALPVTAEAASPLPSIARLDSGDMVFRQYLLDVEASRRLLFSSRQNTPVDLASSLTIYSYTPGDGEGLLGIAARCSVPYATIASLNRFSNIEDLASGKVLLLPSVPGIFIPETPGSDLERLITSARVETSILLSIPWEGGMGRFRFIPGDDFSPTERVFFLNRGFRFPLRNFQLTSPYGPRVNPVTGRAGMHQGLDLAAPEGTEVYAVRNGRVVDLGEDPVFGKFIIIGHENNMLSLYGHLSSIDTNLNRDVQSGSLIGRVGSTGQSTGPHLHFELRQNGQSRDPARMLGLFRGNTGR